MKKYSIYLLIAASVLLALTGCMREENTEPEAGITVQASVGPMTKLSYEGNSTNFVKGDEITVYAWMDGAAQVPSSFVVNGVKNSFDGSKWTPQTQMVWGSLTAKHYFLGIYPAITPGSLTADDYVLDPDKQMASDLMVATELNGITPTTNAVPLEFRHVMAKLNVNLKFRTQWEETPAVGSVTVTAKSGAKVNYLTGEVTAAGDAEPVAIFPASEAAESYALSYSGIQVPQEGVREITITIGNREYIYTSSKDIPLVEGKYTTIGLNVGNDVVKLDDEITVGDWVEEDINGAEAERITVSWESGGDNIDLTYDNKPIVINIDRTDASEAISVPVTFYDATGVYSNWPKDTTIYSTINFAVGEYVKSYTLQYDFSSLIPGTEYNFQLSFDEKMSIDGHYNVFEGKALPLLEYEDCLTGAYDTFWYVNSSTVFDTSPGTFITNLDDNQFFSLQRLKGKTGYYKMILFDDTLELEFYNPGNKSLSFNKFPGYNDSWTWDRSTNRITAQWVHKGTTYSFECRLSYCSINKSSGEEIVENTKIELEGWIKKDGSYYPNSYNTYHDFIIPDQKSVHRYVDMGEVTIGGVKKHLYVATCNVGADNPWDYGDYYAWGETAKRTHYSWVTYSMFDGNTFSKYTGSDYTTLQSEDDAASKLWGGSWRIPTDEEWQALLGADYEWVWTTDYLGSGKDGMLVTRNDDGSGTDPCAGNSIFLPAPGSWYGSSLRNEGSYGYYWSSSLNSSSTEYAWCVGIYSGGALRLYESRCCGHSLRPVKE